MPATIVASRVTWAAGQTVARRPTLERHLFPHRNSTKRVASPSQARTRSAHSTALLSARPRWNAQISFAMLKKAVGAKAVMWSLNMIGSGIYHYR